MCIGSDHKIVCANFRLSLRNTKRPSVGRCQFNAAKLKDEIISNKFDIELKNNFNVLFDEAAENGMSANDQIQARSDALSTALIKASESVLGKRTRTNHPSWVSSKTIELTNDQDKAKLKYKQRPTIANKTKWHKLQKQVSFSYERDKANHLSGQLEELELAANKHEYGAVWKIVGYISQMPDKQIKVRKLDGSIPHTIEESLEDWSKYFKNLLNNKNANANPTNHPVPATTDHDISTSTITRSEVVFAISRLKGSKAPGPD
ncbi:MAG: hypothetical protein HYZ50_07005 [Deltaproteobacteria bacterium]|nr:hypothetical protein [Deltaproteobacteria bacterium]